MTARLSVRRTTSVDALLNTLENERYARNALLLAFLDDLRDAVPESAPPSTKRLLASAESRALSDAEVETLLEELRACAVHAA